MRNAAIAALLTTAVAAAPTPPPADDPHERPKLAEAPDIEQQTLERLLNGESWPRRAIAALRLERYGCEPSSERLQSLLTDPAWQVRAFAIRSLARRRIPAQPHWFVAEDEPRVVRTILRHGYAFDQERLGRGVRLLSRSNDLKQKMLAAEIGAAGGDEELRKLALETTRTIMLRMNRVEAGALSPRLAALTGQHGLRRPYHWQQFVMKTGRSMTVHPALLIADGNAPLEPSLIGQLDAEPFVALETYMATLSAHEVDLAIALDCTASMGREILAAQGGIDDMMLFVGDVVSSLRVAMIGYRDRQDEFETLHADFTDDIAAIRHQLWQLSADGGGDEPEAVYPAMQVAFTQLNWRPNAQKVLVIVGDAPPHVGYGAACANLARRAQETAEVTTHTIEAKGKTVKHFAEIAEAGGGRCVSLRDADTLMAEITGLTLGDRYEHEFREFFRVYLELCR